MTEQDNASDKRLAQQLDLLAGKEVPEADPELQAEMCALRLILLEHQDSILTNEETAYNTVYPTRLRLADTLKQAIAKLLSPPVLASLAGISLLAVALPTLLTLSTPPSSDEEARTKSGKKSNIEIVTTTPQQTAEQLKNLFDSQNLAAKLQENEPGQWQITSENVKLEQAHYILTQLLQQYPDIQPVKLEDEQDIILKLSAWNHIESNYPTEFITALVEQFTANNATMTQRTQINTDLWQLEIQLPPNPSEGLLELIEEYDLQELSNGRIVIRILRENHDFK